MLNKLAALWDWVDQRDIDKHALAIATFWYTIYLIDWVLEYVFTNPTKSGVEVGLVVAAILLPWTPVQGYVFKWYFERKE